MKKLIQRLIQLRTPGFVLDAHLSTPMLMGRQTETRWCFWSSSWKSSVIADRASFVCGGCAENRAFPGRRPVCPGRVSAIVSPREGGDPGRPRFLSFEI